jgi:hypothetical protein
MVVLVGKAHPSTYQPIHPLCELEVAVATWWFKSASGHAMSPSCLTGGYSGKGITLVNWGSSQLFATLIKRVQCVATIAKRDRYKYSKRSLSIARIMASGDTCPLLAILVWSQPMG